MFIDQLLNDVQVGDLVFIRAETPLMKLVSRATDCWANHVGFIYDKTPQRCIVAESRIPLSGKTDLAKFLARSRSGRFAILRLKSELSEHQQSRLKQSADRRMSKLYHLGFNLHSSRQFCSKFIYEVFLEALQIEVGKPESFAQLLRRNPEESLWFWHCWYFGHIPWHRQTITPACQLHSPLLTPVGSDQANHLKSR